MTQKLEELYSLQWFRNRTKSLHGPHRSSQYLADIIYKRYQPLSAIDLGAGTCAFANRLGSKKHVAAVAVEGSAFCSEFATHCHFITHDLRKPWPRTEKLNVWARRPYPQPAPNPPKRNLSGIRYELVTSWDVIEHIPPRYEKQIVNTVMSLAGDLVLLSIDASTWGHHHVNCRPKSYWIKRFGAGLRYDETETKSLAAAILQDPRITSRWYARNLMVFRASKHV